MIALHLSSVPTLVKVGLHSYRGRGRLGQEQGPLEGFCGRGTLSEIGVSFPESCLFLLLYMYITSRPDKVASETQWLQLEQEVKLWEPYGEYSSPHPKTPQSLLPSPLERKSFYQAAYSLSSNSFRDSPHRCNMGCHGTQLSCLKIDAILALGPGGWR